MVLVEGPPVKKNPFGQAVIVGGTARENHQIGQHAVCRTSVNKEKREAEANRDECDMRGHTCSHADGILR
jgi:hypothetical protein